MKNNEPLQKRIVEKFKLRCGRCGNIWYSATKSTRETSCSRCQAYIRLPDELIAHNASKRVD